MLEWTWQDEEEFIEAACDNFIWSDPSEERLFFDYHKDLYNEIIRLYPDTDRDQLQNWFKSWFILQL